MMSESLSTTPDNAITPIRLTSDRSYPSRMCPITAPTMPNGIASMTINGWM